MRPRRAKLQRVFLDDAALRDRDVPGAARTERVNVPRDGQLLVRFA